MLFNLFSLLGPLLLVSELSLAIFQRSARTGATAAAGGSHRWLWVIVGLALFAAFRCTSDHLGLQLTNGYGTALRATAIGLFAIGSALRWWAIRRLGRFFTVDIATAADQTVVEDGPYRWMRHPSYTGLLLQFAGFALTFNNVASFFIVLGPVTAALLYRINGEEKVLRAKLGEPYADYCRRTKRLVPGVY